MISIANKHECALQQRIKQLIIEQQTIYHLALYRTIGLTKAEQSRLDQIAYEMALVQDECNRVQYHAQERNIL